MGSPALFDQALVGGSMVHTPGGMVPHYTPAGKDSTEAGTLRQLHRDRSGNFKSQVALPQIPARTDGQARKGEPHSSRLNLKHYHSRNAGDGLVRMRERRFERKPDLRELAPESNELQAIEKGHLQAMGSTMKRNHGIKSEQSFKDFYESGKRVLKVLPASTSQFASLSH